MANKLKFEQLNKRRHGLEHPAKDRVSPTRDAAELEVGQQTRIEGNAMDRQLISRLRKLLAQARTPRFFVLPEFERISLVRTVRTLHEVIQLSRTIEGYVGGKEYRQAKRLLDMQGPLPRPKLRYIRRVPPGA